MEVLSLLESLVFHQVNEPCLAMVLSANSRFLRLLGCGRTGLLGPTHILNPNPISLGAQIGTHPPYRVFLRVILAKLHFHGVCLLAGGQKFSGNPHGIPIPTTTTGCDALKEAFGGRLRETKEWHTAVSSCADDRRKPRLSRAGVHRSMLWWHGRRRRATHKGQRKKCDCAKGFGASCVVQGVTVHCCCCLHERVMALPLTLWVGLPCGLRVLGSTQHPHPSARPALWMLVWFVRRLALYGWSLINACSHWNGGPGLEGSQPFDRAS